MRVSDYIQCDALELVRRLRDGEVSAEGLRLAARARLEEMEPALRFLAHDFDLSPTPTHPDAENGPFAGIPFLLKDELDLRGYPVTWGSRLLDGYLSEETHPMIARMLQAGFVPLGRTKMSELGLLPLTEPLAGGPTHNPWKRGYSPGGSSGGSAAAVASGVVPVAHGGDGGGSIRVPASACGLVGLKPSRGRNPGWSDDPPTGLTVYNCLSRTVRDTAAFLDSVCGARLSDRFQLPPLEEPYIEAMKREPGSLRIAYTDTDLWGDPLHPEVQDALSKTADRLADLGHDVARVPSPVEGEAFAAAFRVVWAAGAGVFFQLARRGLAQRDNLPALLRGMLRSPSVFRLAVALPLGGGAPMVEKFTRRLADIESKLSPSDFWVATIELERIGNRISGWFRSFDAWLTCSLARPPMRIGEFSPNRKTDTLERELLSYVSFLPVANATGLPGISVPAGQSQEGLPIGIHLMGPMAREDRLLAVARQLEEVHPWPLLANLG